MLRSPGFCQGSNGEETEVRIRYATSPGQLAGFDTESLRENYLVEDLFSSGEVRLAYTHHDRMIIGGAVPRAGQELPLEAVEEMRAEYFLERREIGIFALGGKGYVTVDGERYDVEAYGCLYVGLGERHVTFGSSDLATRFYFVSTLAHRKYPTRVSDKNSVRSFRMGDAEFANLRTLNQHIHADGIQSCQLMMGLTSLDPGSVWNTMPPHTHDRRSEVYLYVDLSKEARVLHFMGDPRETRHLVVANEEAVISPSWSIHSGAGTTRYSFIWAMAGENYTFDDMDHVSLEDLR